MESIPYKQYTRTPRSQAVTNNFSGGMCYTNQPIQEGYCRLLVNYDVTNSGGGLSSRPGLFVTNHQIVKAYTTDSDEFKAFDLTASKFLTEAQVRNLDWHYEPVYIFLKDAMVINDREGLGTICTIMQNLSGEQVLSEQAQARCINPAPKTVFDFPFQNSRELLQPLYCTAWNDSFYTFLKDVKDNKTKLAYLEKNKTTIIDPKVPTELELENIGYNALQTNMYSTVVPKNPLIPSFSTNTKGWSGMDIGETDAYSIGVVDAVNLEAVDPTKLKPNTLYYIIINYHLPSSLIDQQIWSDDKYADQERTVIFKLIDTETSLPINMEDYAHKISLPIKDTLQLFCKKSKGTVRTVNTYFDNLQKHDLATNSYTFVSGRGRYINDQTGFYGYRDDIISYAPKLLYFPFMTESGAYSKTLAVHLTEHYSVGHNYSGSKETFKDISITVAAPEDIEQDFSKRNNYTLASGKTLVFWKNRLWVGNVPEDPTMLFYSQTDMPEYFPYPSNTHVFTEPIVKLITMKDSLLVFTKSKLYSLNYTDELQLTIKCIQQNLYITEADAHLILTVKNMVFFKSGNYYYMVVPKANSLTNELTIAPISKNITGFLDNFKNSIYNTLYKTYDINKEALQELRLINYYNFLDYEDIINVFKFTTFSQEYEEESEKEKEYQDYYVLLLYNSVSRYWRLYILCYPHMDNITNRIQAVTNNATQRAEYILLKKVIGTKKYINVEQLNTVSVDGDTICLKDLSPLNKSLKITDTRPLDFAKNGSYEVLVSLGKRSGELEVPQDLKGPIHELILPFKPPEILDDQINNYFILQLQMSCNDKTITKAAYWLDLKSENGYTRLSYNQDIDFSKPVTIVTRITASNIKALLEEYGENLRLRLHFGFATQFQEQAKAATITVSQLDLWDCKRYSLKPSESVWVTSESFDSFIVHRTQAFEGMDSSIQVTYNNFATETAPQEQGFIALETLKWDKTQVTDYCTDTVQTVWSAALNYQEGQEEPEINNPKFHSLEISDIETSPIFTYLDTGYLTVTPTLKKRFREYQFGLARQVLEQGVDETSVTLVFDFTFYMDSEQRQHRKAFSPYLRVDDSGDFKQLLIRHFSEQTVHPEYTLPTGTDTGSTRTELRECDTDAMLETDMNYKIRIPISGKGYLPRFTLRTKFQKPYTIYNQALVCRTLNAR